MVYLTLIVLAALALRSALSFSVVITPERVNFQDNDSWYHMRLIDSAARNWPYRPAHDPFVLPGGQSVPVAPLFDVTVGGAAALLGLGDPSPRLIELVAAWAPVVLGALIPLAVFAAGRRLFDPTSALIAAALVAIMPGHLLERSRLGYVDHHVLEALMATVTLWLMVRALQQDTRPAVLRAAAWCGAAIAAYLLSWASGAFLVAIVVTWLACQSIVDSLSGRWDARPSTLALTMALVALPLVWLLQAQMYQRQFQLIALAGLAGAAASILLVGEWLATQKRSPRLLPGVLIALGAIAWVVLSMVSPSITGGVIGQIDRMRPDATAFTVVEAMPLTTFASMPWLETNPFMVLGTGLPLGAIGLLLMVAALMRRPKSEWLLMLVWTVFVLISTLLRNRFGYYLVPMLALLGGWVCTRFLSLAQSRGWARDAMVAAIGALAVAPNLWPARAQVIVDAGLPAAWVSALDWLRKSTPPAFAAEGFYLKEYAGEEAVQMPQHTIMAWWDYGYWIARGAQRVPVANPTQAGAAGAGAFFTETDPARAEQMLDNLDARYIVVDSQLPFRIVAPPVYVMGRFETIVSWSGRKHSDFYEALYVRGERGELLPAMVFYPAYYQTMMNRLYMFDGQRVTPSQSSVMSYADKVAANGVAYREVTRMETFGTYEEALARLNQLGPGPHRLVGIDPHRSPVPLEPLPAFSVAWQSDQLGQIPQKPAVVVFQRSLKSRQTAVLSSRRLFR